MARYEIRTEPEDPWDQGIVLEEAWTQAQAERMLKICKFMHKRDDLFIAKFPTKEDENENSN